MNEGHWHSGVGGCLVLVVNSFIEHLSCIDTLRLTLFIRRYHEIS